MAASGGALAGAWRIVASGKATLDLGIGRSVRPLGPMTLHIAAPRDTVFDVLAAPYLARTPRALETKLRVLERSEDMVLAAHFTPVGRYVTTTVETVRFERPGAVHFRVVRGPVPHVLERFVLDETEAGTDLRYDGELGADLWAVGRWWSRRVAQKWEATVAGSLEDVKREAERRAPAPGMRSSAP